MADPPPDRDPLPRPGAQPPQLADLDELRNLIAKADAAERDGTLGDAGVDGDPSAGVPPLFAATAIEAPTELAVDDRIERADIDERARVDGRTAFARLEDLEDVLLADAERTRRSAHDRSPVAGRLPRHRDDGQPEPVSPGREPAQPAPLPPRAERQRASRSRQEPASRQQQTASRRPQRTGSTTAGSTGLLRSNLVVATGTLLSRLTGLVRVAVLSAVIGKTALTDAYNIGNETPNIVYELLLGGVLSATLVPLFTSFLGSGRDGSDDDESASVIISVTLVVLGVLTALAVLAAPLVFGIYSITIGEGVDADVFRRVGTALTRIFLLQIFFYGSFALLSAILNSRRRFFAAAWAPVLANVVVIASLLSLNGSTWQYTQVLDSPRLRWTLGLGTTAAIAAMAVALVPAVRNSGFRFRWRFQPRHPVVKKLMVLSGWTLGYVLANQVVVIVVRNLTEPGSSGSSAYFNAFTVFVLPHGLLAMSVATTFVPDLVRSVSAKDRRAFIARITLGIRVIALLTIPAGVALFVLRLPLIGLFLQRGEFDAFDTWHVAYALAGFALGLGAFSIYLFTLRGFYSHQDTRTPFIINVGQCLLNIVFALALAGRYGVMGLGAAFAASYVIAALWALVVLSYKVPGFDVRATIVGLVQIFLAAGVGGQVAWFAARHVGGNAGFEALARVLAGSLAGGVVYVAALAALGTPELVSARAMLRRRLAR